MADKKISELVELVTPSATDKLPIVDGTETKYIEYQNLVTNQVEDSITNGVTDKAPSQNAVFGALALKQDNLGFTPENSTNKTNTVAGNEASTSLYLSVKGYYDYLIGLVWLTATRFGTWITGLTAKATPLDSDTIIVNDGDAKKTTLTQFKAFLKTYFDTIYGSAFSGTVNKIPRFTSSNTIGDSPIQINDVGTSTEYIFNTKRTYIQNIENDVLPALQVIKNQTSSSYLAFQLSSSSGGTDETVNTGSNHNVYGRRFVNNSSSSYNQWIQTFDKTLSERNGTAVTNANIVLIRDGRAITATAPPDNYGIGHYYNVLGSSNNIYQKYLGFYACNLNVGAGTYGFRWMDEDSTGGAANVRRELANLNQDGVLTLNPKVSGVGNGFITSNGAKIGNNTDTPIVSGGGTVLWNGKSFDIGDGVGGTVEYYNTLIARKYTAYSFTTSTVITTTAIVLNSFAVAAKGVNDISISTLRAGSVIKFKYKGVLSANIANGTRTINVKLGTVQVLNLACAGDDSNFSSGNVLTIEGDIILDTSSSSKGNLLVNFGSTKANYIMASTTATNIAAFISGSLNIELVNNNVETATMLGSSLNIEITK